MEEDIQTEKDSQTEKRRRGPRAPVPSIAIPPEFAERMFGISVTENLEPVVAMLSQKLAEKSYQPDDVEALVKAMELVLPLAKIVLTGKEVQAHVEAS